jgi:DNA-binding SARP family transcriptional activator
VGVSKCAARERSLAAPVRTAKVTGTAARRAGPVLRAGSAGTQLRLLNGFELVCDGLTISVPAGAQRLVAFLALHRRPALRGYIAGSLWPETSEERAHANLRSTLWRVQRCSKDLVEVHGPQLCLGSCVTVDLFQAEALARGLLVQPLVDCLESSLDVLSFDLLPDWYDDWMLIERERFRHLRLRAQDALCERLMSAGRFTEASELGLSALAGEPLRESAHRALVRIHLAEGNIFEAVRQYEFCRRLFGERLGVEPSEEMDRLFEGVTGWKRSGDEAGP